MDWQIFFYQFLKSREIFFEYLHEIDEKMFGNSILANLMILCRKFAEKYKRPPDSDTLALLLDKLPAHERDNKKAYETFLTQLSVVKVELDIEVFRDELNKAIHNFSMEKFILATANKVGKVTFEDVMADIRQLVQKSGARSSGLDVTDVERAIKIIRYDMTEKVTSGIEPLDKMLSGGFGAEEIAIIMAPPGRGKSLFLINSFYNAMLAGKNALYVTFELSEKAVLRRIYSRISYSSRKDMQDEATVMKRANKYFTLAKAKGRVIYYPSKSLTVEGLEAVLDQQMLYYDFTPEILIVDYLDLLAPRQVDYKLDPRHRLRGVTDDLRSIALRRKLPVLTATQANRASLSKVKITEANVAESFGKIEVADVILALCQTDEEMNLQRARLLVLKNRDYISGGCVETFIDKDKMLLMGLDLANRLGIMNKIPEGTVMGTEPKKHGYGKKKKESDAVEPQEVKPGTPMDEIKVPF